MNLALERQNKQKDFALQIWNNEKHLEEKIIENGFALQIIGLFI